MLIWESPLNTVQIDYVTTEYDDCLIDVIIHNRFISGRQGFLLPKWDMETYDTTLAEMDDIGKGEITIRDTGSHSWLRLAKEQGRWIFSGMLDGSAENTDMTFSFPVDQTVIRLLREALTTEPAAMWSVQCREQEDLHILLASLIIGTTEELLQGEISHSHGDSFVFHPLLRHRRLLPSRLRLALELGTELEAAHKALSPEQYENSIRQIQQLCREEIREAVSREESSPLWHPDRCRHSLRGFAAKVDE